MTDAPHPEGSRRSIRHELPHGEPPKMTAAALVKYVRMVWREAKKGGHTDALAILWEAPEMRRRPQPRVFTAGMTTMRGLAALCSVLLANSLRGPQIDDPRIVEAQRLLDDYVRNPPRVGGRLPPP